MSTSKPKPRWLEKAVIQYLKDNPDKKFPTVKIAAWVLDTHRSYCLQKKSLQRFKHDDNAMTQQLRGEIGRSHKFMQGKEPKIKTIEGPTRYFYYDTKIEIEADEENVRKDDEIALYNPLCEFLYSELDIYCKRIDEKTSSNSFGKKGNIWLHPDIVGLEVPKWKKAVISSAVGYTGDKPNLWSFEVKKQINPSNIRESFFQAIANSSWANFGYLVAEEIISSGKMNVMKELRMLSTLHGIGCIALDKSAPRESHIIVPASRRSEVDWHSVNRIASENTDFLKYVELIEGKVKKGKITEGDWVYDKSWDSF